MREEAGEREGTVAGRLRKYNDVCETRLASSRRGAPPLFNILLPGHVGVNSCPTAKSSTELVVRAKRRDAEDFAGETATRIIILPSRIDVRVQWRASRALSACMCIATSSPVAAFRIRCNNCSRSRQPTATRRYVISRSSGSRLLRVSDIRADAAAPPPPPRPRARIYDGKSGDRVCT